MGKIRLNDTQGGDNIKTKIVSMMEFYDLHQSADRGKTMIIINAPSCSSDNY